MEDAKKFYKKYRKRSRKEILTLASYPIFGKNNYTDYDYADDLSHEDFLYLLQFTLEYYRGNENKIGSLHTENMPDYFINGERRKMKLRTNAASRDLFNHLDGYVQFNDLDDQTTIGEEEE